MQYCNGLSFCERARAFKYDVEASLEASQKPDLFYYCDACSPEFDDEEKSVSFPLSKGCNSTGQLAKELQFKMWFHQDGIAQILIGEPGNSRFQISQEDLPVDWDNLRPGNVTKGTVKDDGVKYIAYGEDGLEIYTYHIFFNPFKIEQHANGKLA